MKFPLNLSFKVLALAPQIVVTDSDGNNVCYVRQKMMKLREAIEVFTDKKKGEKICDIKTDKIIDFSATYHFYDTDGQTFGAVARQGMRSLWKAHYTILKGETPVMTIQEENPWIKMLDGIVDGIPIVGGIAGYVLNPSYLITDITTEKPLLRIKKRPAFFESKFSIDRLDNFEAEDELRMVVATIMMVLLEKDRG